MSGRAATTDRRPGRYALSVGRTDMLSPPGWQWVELRQIARLESGHTPSRRHPTYWNGGIPWIGIKDARKHHGKQIQTTFQTVSSEGLDNSAARLLPPRTVCLSRTASVGYSLVMGKSMATSQDFVNWVCSDAIEPEFLMQLFIAEGESLRRFGSGTTHTTIYYPEVKAFHVCLPPLPEQRRVVESLDTHFSRLDAAVASLKRAQANLKRYRASVLQAAVEGRLVPTEAEIARRENRDYEPASVLLERILCERRRRWEEAELARLRAKGKEPKNDRWKAKYKEPVAPDTEGLTELPEGWCWGTAEQLTDPDKSITYGVVKLGSETDGGVPTLRTSNVRHVRLDLAVVKRISPTISAQYRRTVLRGGEVLVAVRGTLGGVVETSASCAGFNVSREVAVLVLLMPAMAPLIARFIASPRLQAWLTRRTRGIAYTGINIATLKTLPIPLPPESEHPTIVAVADRHLSLETHLLDEIGAASRHVARLRRSILAWAFQGRLVDQDQSDEPASVLLERIRKQRESEATKKPRRGRKRKTS